MMILCWLLANLQFGYTYAPELIQGATIGISTEAARIAYLDGGNWQALQIGTPETGVFIHLSGETIDNDNLPVPYRYEWRDNGKARGFIIFRGHERKLCFAPAGKELPCR